MDTGLTLPHGPRTIPRCPRPHNAARTLGAKSHARQPRSDLTPALRERIG